jgi:uncharacterized damage-inducible protein DinB
VSEQPEAWQRGPLPGVPPLLMPAAHAFVQVSEELAAVVAGLDERQLWARPGGVASVGFHLRHIAGSSERLLTYARGEALREEQVRAARQEGDPPRPGESASALVAAARAGIERALAQLRATPETALLEARSVGRRQLPSTVLGLLFHAAEHAQRHCGQAATTARIVRAGARDSGARA